jgi:hypothetical protein
MEEFGGAKEETFDELVTKHTRRELEEMALKYGVENLGGTKSQLADAILEAMKKQKEPPRPSAPTAPKEVPMVEKPKTTARLAGKKGVMAKAAAIDSEAAMLQKAGKDIREQGIREMSKSVREYHSAQNLMSKEMQSKARKMNEDGQRRFQLGQAEFRRSLDAQKKENHEAAGRLHSGAREIRSSQEKMSREFQRTGESIRQDGYRRLQNGLNRFRSDVDSQIKENREAVSMMNSGARELQERAASFQGEIHRYQEQDLKNYVRDFYYG